jgi:hypothetical protein
MSARDNNAMNHSMLQKTHGTYKPVRDFDRFLKDKVANTGYDPKRAFYEFMINDIPRPLSRPRPFYPQIETPHEKWALKTDKNAAAVEKVPKLQQYKDYFFPNRAELNPDSYRSKFLPTDNVSIRVPKIEKRDDKDSYLHLKGKFGPHTVTDNPWVPQGNFKTINNRSSVDWNLISHDENKHGGALVVTVSDRKVINRKKGVAEIADLTRTFYPNFSKKYDENYKENKNIFHTCNGIFSYMYDAAHKNGNIIMPFKNDKKK